MVNANDGTDRSSKIERAAWLFIYLRFRWWFKRASFSNEERIELTALAQDISNQVDLTPFTQEEPPPSETLVAWFDYYKSVIINMSDEDASRLGRIALREFSDSEPLIKMFGDDALMLAKGELKRKVRVLKWTGERVAEACSLHATFHARIRAGRKHCTHHRQMSGASAAKKDRELYPAAPRMPRQIVINLPLKQGAKTPAQLAAEWTAIEMKQRHPNFSFTADGITKQMKEMNSSPQRQIVSEDEWKEMCKTDPFYPGH